MVGPELWHQCPCSRVPGAACSGTVSPQAAWAGWLMPGIVVVWSWNQDAIVLGSVGEKEQKAAEGRSRPSCLSSEQWVPCSSHEGIGGACERRCYTQGALELQLQGSCLKGDQAGLCSSPLPWECGGLV